MTTIGNFSPEQKASLLANDHLGSDEQNEELVVTNKSCGEYCYDFFPTPPHRDRYGSERSETCYDQWANYCYCVSEPEVNQMLISNSRPTRYAGEMCQICMSPVYCLDRLTYKICCCGDYQNCNCTSTPCAQRLFCYLSIPKLPCVVLSMVGGGVGWLVGSVQNLVCGTDPADRLDIEESKEIKDENHRPAAVFNSADRGQILQNKIEACIINHNLFPIIKFLQEKDLNIDQVCGAISVSYGLPLLCLAINYEKDDVLLKERTWLITHLLRNGVSINGVSLPEYRGWTKFLIPLYEALTSRYIYAPQLLAFLCEMGANVYQPVLMKNSNQCIRVPLKKNNIWIKVPVFNWACMRYLSYRFREERQRFLKKVEILQNFVKKSAEADLNNYIAAKNLLIQLIGIDEIVDLIGGYSNQFFKPATIHVKPEIKHSEQREKKDEFIDQFGVLTEFEVEDELGFRTVPIEYSLALPIQPETPRGGQMRP